MPEKPKVTYRSTDELVLQSLHLPVSEYLYYDSIVTIKDGGTNPVTIKLKFDGIPPEWAEMPPKEHTIHAPTVIDLYRKMNRWFRKYGYRFYTHRG